MPLRFVVALFAVFALAPSPAGAKISESVVASVAPSRALDEARAASEIREPRGDANAIAIAERLARVEERIARLEEDGRHEARARDNLIQARFEDTDRKIIEVVGRLQVFVGCLIVLLLAIFVWLADLARRGRPAKATKASRVAVTPEPRSSRLG